MNYTYNKATKYHVKYDSNRKYVVTKHQLLMEKKIGRRLRPGERVDHINGNKSDTRLSNLKLVNQSEHNKLHKVWKGSANRSVQMSSKQRSIMSAKAWAIRRRRWGKTGSKDPNKLRRLVSNARR